MITEIRMDKVKFNSEEGAKKLAEVAHEMHQILNSTLFRDKVLKMGMKPGERSEWKNKTNKEIYKRLMSGAEDLDENNDNVINLEVYSYYSPMRVVGYIVPGKKNIWVNTKFFNGRSNKLVGSNLVHEYSHQLGFRHDSKRTKDRPSSISYQLNKIYEACHDHLIGSSYGYLKRVKVGGFWFWSRYEWRRVYDA